MVRLLLDEAERVDPIVGTRPARLRGGTAGALLAVLRDLRFPGVTVVSALVSWVLAGILLVHSASFAGVMQRLADVEHSGSRPACTPSVQR